MPRSTRPSTLVRPNVLLSALKKSLSLQENVTVVNRLSRCHVLIVCFLAKLSLLAPLETVRKTSGALPSTTAAGRSSENQVTFMQSLCHGAIPVLLRNPSLARPGAARNPGRDPGVHAGRPSARSTNLTVQADGAAVSHEPKALGRNPST